MSVSQPSYPSTLTGDLRPAMFLWHLAPTINAPMGALDIANTLPVAELAHRALVKLVGGGRRIDCPEITGQLGCGQPLSGPHGHCHVLPIDTNDDSSIDHILLYAPMGFSKQSAHAIAKLRTLFGPTGKPLVTLALTRTAHMNRWLAGKISTDGLGESAKPPSIAESGCRSWSSLTPFVPARFLKKSGRNTLEGQIQAELACRNLPAAEHIMVLSDLSHAMRGFKRVRSRDAAPPPQNVGMALQLIFPQPICGPLCLGYASHFGVGLFRTAPAAGT